MFRNFFSRTTLAVLPLLAMGCHAVSVNPLTLDTYNPGDKGVFAVSSELIMGQREAVLIDAQFARTDAEQLVKKVQDSGRTLTTIYVSHSDPDFYFGLDVLKAAFPDARIVATPQTVAAIRASMEGKLRYWSPILKDNAPRELVLPTALDESALTLEGHQLEIMGLDGPAPDHTYVWVPALKAVVGGVVVFGQQHVWMADTQTPASRQHWLETLAQIESLQPTIVIPGHHDASAPLMIESVRFTRDYLKAFEEEAAKAHDSTELIAAMKRRYPTLKDVGTLELSAKVIKGEMKWPAN